MYSITKNIKRTSFLLIFIGIICLGFGFFESLSSHVSDKEIKYKVKEVYKKYNKEKGKTSLEDSLNLYQKMHDNLIFERDSIMRTNFVNSEGYSNWLTTLTKKKEFIEIKIDEFELNNSDVMLLILSEIEKDLNCHFTSAEIEKSKSEEDVYVATKHYFHAKAQRPWSSILWSNLFFLMVAVAAGLWWAIQYVARAGWSAMILRVPQAITSYIPYGGGIMLILIILAGLHWNHIYHWMDESLNNKYVVESSIEKDHPIYTNEEVYIDSSGEELVLADESLINKYVVESSLDLDYPIYTNEEVYIDSNGENLTLIKNLYYDSSVAESSYLKKNSHYDYIVANKSIYLNFPFFLLRSIIYILGWVWMISLMKKYSYNEDRLGGKKWYQKSFKVSVAFVLFLGLTSTTAAWDWVMSIDPHWFSTLFGWYSLASFFITACAFIAAITIYLMYKGHFKSLNNSHMHDFGRYLLAFSIFWTYLWFAQYMLIWYANIPEEVVYYQERYEFYKPLLLMTLAINFLAPFFLLMDRSAKRSKGTLLFVAILIIIGHAFDVFIMVMPGTMHSHWHFGYVEIGTFLGFLGFFILVVFTSLSKRQLVQKNHPMLGESKHHEILIH
tara:strand:- start:12 stop:1847 length:1836 start_codon:yes stop_codon:yes gene_type:complete